MTRAHPLSMKRSMKASRPQRGTTMMEVLVTIFLLSLGLLGLAALQSRLQVSEIEAYQRTQAMLLLTDMTSRISTNRAAAANYATAVGLTAVGSGMTCPTATTTLEQRDVKQWCEDIQGASETKSGSRVGTVTGGRGCIESLGNSEYMVTVAWQGMISLRPPASSTACGQNDYDGGSCSGDRCRRVVSSIVKIGVLQ